ncbi:MAG: molybdenum cofactor guanylyltransferase [Bacteroidota bacterium]
MLCNRISGVILAGGVSKRFQNTTKANIVIGGKTIMSRITETLQDIFEEIVIVTNTPEEFKKFDNYTIVTDQFINAGPLGGIHAALKASSKEALFVFAGDMPLLDKKYIIRQIDYYNSHKCDILVPRIKSYIEPLHAIYNLSLIKVLEEYLTRDHDNAVRAFFKVVNVRYMQLEDTEETKNAFMNVNSPDEISIIEKILLLIIR